MSYESRVPEVKALMDRAAQAGLIAAAQVYINAVKRELRGGYTTGDYVTGNVINSVTRTERDPQPPKQYEDDDGVMRETPTTRPQVDTDGFHIMVGTNVIYARHWELGWTPRMGAEKTMARLWSGETAPMYRVPIWLPQLVAQGEAMRRAFERVHKRTMAGQ